MTQADFGIALLLFLVVVGFSIYSWAGPLRRERLKSDQYRLFAIRDKLVRLVAEDKIVEDDSVGRSQDDRF